MSGVAAGFTVVFVIIAMGFLLGRSGTLGEHGQFVLSRLVFFVATPALLFDSLAHSDLSVVFSPILTVSAVSAFAVAGSYLLIARVWLRRPLPELTIGALAASFVNSANLGIPIAVFVLGDASFVAPLMLFQIMIFSPIALALLDISTMRSSASRVETVMAPFKNPIVLAGAAGLIVAASTRTPPEPLMQPFRLMGGVAVPGALLTFGLSLHGVRVLETGASSRRDVALVSVLKICVQPLVAYSLARFALGLSGHELFAVVVLSALPTAQNVFIYASHYQRGMVLARDSAFVTTLASIPATGLVTALLV
ncbi:AEC family transporter [Rhodococcus qingshengii]|uniref:AEC family transporter n=1 Tax=Rhodococcus qingshengii TaxID=334542 RepID=UPI0036DE23F6